MFDDFQHGRSERDGVTVDYVAGGSGPPVVLLHGFPQTRAMWREVAPVLAATHTVVLPDLRGYGASSVPPSEADHAQASFRAMAADVAALMRGLGHERFAAVGHDRGARVTHRLALDHPDGLERAAVLDILPTLTMYEHTDQAFATAYWHWFFLIQPAPLPETLLAGALEPFLRTQLRGLVESGAVSPEAFAAYLAAARAPDIVRGWCEDYRAAASIDLQHDRADRAAGRRIACPLLVLWGARNRVWEQFGDVLAIWRDHAADEVTGEPLDCGHFLPEEAPARTLELLQGFLRR
jgi:haloacetate dehalogenase